MTKCADIMTERPKYHEPTATVDMVARTMKENDIGPVLIVDTADSMRIVGIVTDRDLAIKVLAEDRDAHKTQVKDVMTVNPITCHPSDNVKDALRMMEECQVRRIPVVDDEKRLVGIIAQADIATRLNKPNKTAEVVEEISKNEGNQPHKRDN